MLAYRDRHTQLLQRWTRLAHTDGEADHAIGKEARQIRFIVI